MADTNEKKTSTENIEVEENTCEKTEDLNNQTEVETPEDALKIEIEQLKDKLMRHAAEFDNYKKRTAKEREELYSIAVCDTIEKILPVKDNLERAVIAAEETEGEKGLADGVKMILNQLDEVFSSIGVAPIASVGVEFDPEKHNAVMHEENEAFSENTISEELMKGYIYKENRVIRHSMVKVAN